MSVPKILVVDGIMARADRPLIGYIAIALSYIKEDVKHRQWGVDIKNREAYMIDRRNGMFYVGLLNRATKYLDTIGVKYEVDTEMMGKISQSAQEPHLQDITFRPDQLRLINNARENLRGVILSPTGSGKTITALGVISMFPKSRALILVHRADIFEQFVDRAARFLKPESVQLVTKGDRPKLTAKLVIATVQTFSKYKHTDVSNLFDITIIDEAHHCCTKRGQFGKFMLNNLAPIKIGFTATLPPEKAKLLTLEGLVGPVIGEITGEEAEELGITARPYVTLLSVPLDIETTDLRKYRDIYTVSIVHNKARNATVIKTALARVNKGLTCLILVKELAHGENLLELAKIFGLTTVFVHGGTVDDMRKKVKYALIQKKMPCVICTDIWREGTDIPTLNTVINAAALKSELYTTQGVGRGLRTAAGKDSVEVIDFLDPYRYLARHSVARISLYMKKGWQIRG